MSLVRASSLLFQRSKSHTKKRGLVCIVFFFQRRVQLEQLQIEVVQDAKRMSLAKRGKMEEKEKKWKKE